MPRCPFCKTYYYEMKGDFVCKCGERIPEGVQKYERERRICGKCQCVYGVFPSSAPQGKIQGGAHGLSEIGAHRW